MNVSWSLTFLVESLYFFQIKHRIFDISQSLNLSESELTWWQVRTQVICLSFLFSIPGLLWFFVEVSVISGVIQLPIFWGYQTIEISRFYGHFGRISNMITNAWFGVGNKMGHFLGHFLPLDSGSCHSSHHEAWPLKKRKSKAQPFVLKNQTQFTTACTCSFIISPDFSCFFFVVIYGILQIYVTHILHIGLGGMPLVTLKDAWGGPCSQL